MAKLKPVLFASAVLALLLFFVLSFFRLFDYYYHYRTIGDKLAALPGVTIVDSWKHEDLTLEDFGYTLKVRDCPSIRVDFYETREWQGLFRHIDGVILLSGNATTDAKILTTSQLKTGPSAIRNLPELLANLETVLPLLENAPGAGTTGPTPDGNYVFMRIVE